MNTPEDVLPNIQLGILVPLTVVIVFYFYYMEFSPDLLQFWSRTNGHNITFLHEDLEEVYIK